MDKYVILFAEVTTMSFSISNRRYTGCKAKLSNWIYETVKKNCPDATSFCDLFAGTGVVAARMFDRFDKIVINDFLYSNEAIYKAFFLKEDYSEEKLYTYYNKFNSLNKEEITDNYASLNYSGNFFSHDDALLIGEIRNQIEQSKKLLNEREYYILLASLLFSADRCSNTCGHYDAYIKGKDIRSSFKFELIDPIVTGKNCSKDIKIYREDSNALASKINCCVTYIDPPYNSRQYSRFYHVLEVLTKWDNPQLYGTARKPQEENMSDYCKSKALDAFKSLIYSLNSKYIVVSYNNTYNSKSSSSKNKMTLEDIERVLSNKGSTKIYRQKYKAFNAGKTDFDGHEEILFVCKVGK